MSRVTFENLAREKLWSDYPTWTIADFQNLTFNDTTAYYKYSNVESTWKNMPKTWGGAMRIEGLLTAEEDNIAPVEFKSNHLTKKESYNLVIDESNNKTYSKPIKENISIMSTYWDIIQFFIQVVEVIKIRDTVAKNEDKKLTDMISALDSIRKNINQHIDDRFVVNDRFDRNVEFFRDINEIINWVEHYHNSFATFQYDSFGIEETKPWYNIGLNKNELLNFLETYSRNTRTTRTYNEGVNLADAIIKSIDSVQYDDINFADVFLDGCRSVMSNIAIAYGEMSLEQFNEKVETPSGYTKFSEFKVGEYEYQEALVRIALDTESMQLQPSVANLTMHVDIPDTDDRGTANITITSAPTKIYYNKEYYNAPEVNITLRNANVSDGVIIPNITSITKTYFEVELRNNQWERTTGTINWMSKGY